MPAMNKKDTTKRIAHGAIIAALYASLCLCLQPFSYGYLQIRAAEALAVLPCFTAAAVPGLFIGCLTANIFGGCVIYDVIFGSLATLIGAAGTYMLRDRGFLKYIPPIAANTIAVPLILYYAYGIKVPILIQALAVGAGETIAVAGLGSVLYMGLKKLEKKLF